MNAHRRLDRARDRHRTLSTGFDAAALALAGVTAELEAAEDGLEELLESEVERPDVRPLSAEEVRRRSRCPAHLYERVYGA